MLSFKTPRGRALLALTGLLVVLQFVPPMARTNPPERDGITAPAEVMEILERSCYDCHSNQTTWPWYSRIAPVSWLVVRDVEKGRKELNFSTWLHLEPRYQENAVDDILREVEEGEMPQARYVWLHGDAALSEADLSVLRGWAQAYRLR